MCNACALLVLCFDYIHSFIVKFVLNPKQINTTPDNFLYLCTVIVLLCVILPVRKSRLRTKMVRLILSEFSRWLVHKVYI